MSRRGVECHHDSITAHRAETGTFTASEPKLSAAEQQPRHSEERRVAGPPERPDR
jgi:hypothetical protein